MSLAGSARQMAVLALGYTISALAATGLFGRYLAFSAHPVQERLIVLFLMPVTATVIWRVIGSLRRHGRPADDEASAEAAIDGIVLAVLVFLMGVHLLLVAVLVGATWVHPWAQPGTAVLLGVTTVAVGNLLPRTRPNMAVGIRTARTLSDRHLWVVTHRVSGYTLVLSGVVTIYAGLFRRGADIAGVSVTALTIAGVWLCAFYWKVTREAGPHGA